MTGIIFKGIEQEKFSIFKFYIARANRIIPALAVLCLVLLVFGWSICSGQLQPDIFFLDISYLICNILPLAVCNRSWF